jgi:hypothetical protein
MTPLIFDGRITAVGLAVTLRSAVYCSRYIMSPRSHSHRLAQLEADRRRPSDILLRAINDDSNDDTADSFHSTNFDVGDQAYFAASLLGSQAHSAGLGERHRTRQLARRCDFVQRFGSRSTSSRLTSDCSIQSRARMPLPLSCHFSDLRRTSPWAVSTMPPGEGTDPFRDRVVGFERLQKCGKSSSGERLTSNESAGGTRTRSSVMPTPGA